MRVPSASGPCPAGGARRTPTLRWRAAGGRPGTGRRSCRAGPGGVGQASATSADRRTPDRSAARRPGRWSPRRRGESRPWLVELRPPLRPSPTATPTVGPAGSSPPAPATCLGPAPSLWPSRSASSPASVRSPDGSPARGPRPGHGCRSAAGCRSQPAHLSPHRRPPSATYSGATSSGGGVVAVHPSGLGWWLVMWL